MAIYRNISTRFWDDPKVKDEFTPEDKYFFLYLLTNSHTNICGCYEISQRDITLETGYNWDTTKMLIDRLVRLHDVIRYSEETKEVLILNFDKYNWSNSMNVIKAIRSVGKNIKNDNFREFVFGKADEREKTVNSKQYTVNSKQYSDTDTDTVVTIGYGYGMDRVSKSKKNNQSRIDQYNSFPQNNYDIDAIEDELLANKGKK